MAFLNSASQEAVYLFDGDTISRELLLSEFEALLEGFIPIKEFAGKNIPATFVLINAQFNVTAAVFFQLAVDVDGLVNRRWNIPYRQLANLAQPGPDMGAGAIALACFSQSPIAWCVKDMWDPCLEPATNTLHAIAKKVKENKLGLVFVEEKSNSLPLTAVPIKDNASSSRKRLAQRIRFQRLRITAKQNAFLGKEERLNREHQERILLLQKELQQLTKQLAIKEDEANRSKELLVAQVEKTRGVKEYFEHKLAQKSLTVSDDEFLEQNKATNDQLRLQELQDQLDRRELELFYRQQNEVILHSQIDVLRAETQQLMQFSGDSILHKVAEAGVNFVAYDIALGQFSLAVEDLPQYLQNPSLVIAQILQIPVDVFTAWQQHYQHSVCTHVSANEQACSLHLIRVDKPSQFIPGDTDRCAAHKVWVAHKDIVGYSL